MFAQRARRRVPSLQSPKVKTLASNQGIAQCGRSAINRRMNVTAHSATKAAQVGFVEALRTEFSGSDIHVSVVLPVSTETEYRDAMARDYGHTVSGSSYDVSAPGPAILVRGITGATVRNGTVQRFEAGVAIEGGSGNVIENLGPFAKRAVLVDPSVQNVTNVESGVRVNNK